jgi:hypothetical protein
VYRYDCCRRPYTENNVRVYYFVSGDSLVTLGLVNHISLPVLMKEKSTCIDVAVMNNVKMNFQMLWIKRSAKRSMC